MGYTTTFFGKMQLTPILSTQQAEELNMFCEERHGGNVERHFGMPSFWCDWETDGEKLYWNGSEKSYEMNKWLEVLIEKFFKPWGVSVSGRMFAQGENTSDTWILEAKDNKVIVHELDLMKDHGITP